MTKPEVTKRSDSDIWQYLLLLGLFGIAYFWETHNEAFEFVEQKIKSSHSMELKVGHVKRVSIDPVSGGSRRSHLRPGTSETVIVTGDKGKVSVKIYVQKTDGVWEVKGASIDGQPITLD